ncbi:blue copper protein 1a-like [Magnolia sinica]|uniref:blue copper protein 1a-like n=1 Tax=Magnolia sinica TaxID=86752 RepID=UPI00265912C7|nr:blue copper protein 1a-like [Magnolia sinica]
MGSKLVSAILILVVIVPTVALATEHMVGDDSGWTIKFDYEKWAEDKEFRVGDKLVFKYPQGVHNVFKVDGTGFKNCVAPSDNEALSTGNDVITLAAPGKKWYICGVGNHCESGGQKLAINVLAADQKSAANGILTFGYQAITAAGIAFAMWFLV